MKNYRGVGVGVGVSVGAGIGVALRHRSSPWRGLGASYEQTEPKFKLSHYPALGRPDGRTIF